jgi:acyl dehydratase
MDKLYLEDLTVGQTFVSSSLTITADEITAFAAQYDPQPFHMDDEAAKRTLFGGLAASGWHTAALTMRLLVQGGGAPLAGGIIGVESEVVEVIPSRSKPDRGMVLMCNRTLNQKGEEVQVFTAKLVVPRRPA